MPQQVEPTPAGQPIVLRMERRSAARWLRDRLGRRASDAAEEKEAVSFFARIRDNMERRLPEPGGRHALPPVPVGPSALPAQRISTPLLTPLPDEGGAAQPWDLVPLQDVPPEVQDAVALLPPLTEKDPFAWLAADPQVIPEARTVRTDQPRDPTIVLQVVRPNIVAKLAPYLASLPRFTEDDSDGSAPAR